MSDQPTCGKCGKVMTPADSRIHPELFLHDACLPDELKPLNEYDPYADLVEANRDQILRMHKEAVRRVGACLCRATEDSGQLSVWHHIEVAQAVLDALNTYHPMHVESWCGWPEGSDP